MYELLCTNNDIKYKWLFLKIKTVLIFTQQRRASCQHIHIFPYGTDDHWFTQFRSPEDLLVQLTNQGTNAVYGTIGPEILISQSAHSVKTTNRKAHFLSLFQNTMCEL